MLAQESAAYCEKSADINSVPNIAEYRTKDAFGKAAVLMRQGNPSRQKAAGAYWYFAYMLLSGSKEFSVQQPDTLKEGSDMQVSYQIPVGSSQQLQVSVSVSPYGSTLRCRITSHKSVSTLTWDENSHIEVWSGQ